MGILYSKPICQAAYDDDIRQVVQLVKQDAKNLNIQDKLFGDTPIIAACRQGNVQTIKYLLQQNADVSIRNKKQRTCLHYAARKTFSFLDYLMIVILMPILLIGYLIMVEKKKRNVDMMKLILNSNVEINAVDYVNILGSFIQFKKGNTALHYTCQRKSDHLVLLLLDKNADTSIKNVDNETPLDIARRMKFKNIVNILKKSD